MSPIYRKVLVISTVNRTQITCHIQRLFTEVCGENRFYFHTVNLLCKANKIMPTVRWKIGIILLVCV